MINLQDFLTGIGFTAKYPYTDIHELNLDWCLAQIATLRVEFDDFAHVNSLKYAGEWDITKAYSAFSVVDDQGFGYMALKPVPPGTQITDTEYWLMVVDYSQLISDVEGRITALETTVGDASSGLVKDVDDLQNDMSTAQSDITALQNTVGDASSGLVKDVDDLQTTVGDASSGLVKDVDDLQGDITRIDGDIVILNNKINAATAIYDTLTDLIADTNVVTGKYVQTLGRSSEGDNGGSFYYITDLTPSGYYETLSNGLFAKPIDAHNVLVFGVVGSGDETAKIQDAILEIEDYIEFNPVTYTISGELVFTQDIHGNDAKIKVNGDLLSAVTTSKSVKELEVFSDASAHVRVGIHITGANSHIENCYVHDLYNDDVSTPNHSVFGIMASNDSKNGFVVIKHNRVNNIVGTYIVAQTVYSAAGIVFNGESNFIVEENSVSNVIDQYNGDCFSIIPRNDDGTVSGVIRSNRAIGGQMDGFKVSMKNAQISENVIRFKGVDPRTSLPYLGVYGIRVQDVHDKIFKNNIIDDTSTVGDYIVGIIAQYTGGGSISDLTIENNSIEGTQIQIYTSYFNDVKITGNYLTSSRSDSTMIYLAGHNSLIADNTIDGARMECSGSNITVTGNNIKNCLVDTNQYTDRHTYGNNFIFKSTINITKDDTLNANTFYQCNPTFAFGANTGNIITSNRYVYSTAPTVPAGNVDANNA